MSFIIELGSQQAVEGGSVWTSQGFLCDWTDSGPVIAPLREDACRFPAKGNAESVIKGSEKLQASRIVEVKE